MANSTNELLQKYIEQITIPQHGMSIDIINKKEDIKSKIDDINTWIIEKTEQQKLSLRDKLSKTVIKFIWIQLLFFNLVVLLIVLSVTVDLKYFKQIDNELATLLFNFLKYYISATIAELLGMLVFILHYVFSKGSLIKSVKNKFNNKEQEI